MAATPPGQITSTPQTPSTPLHGAAYDRSTRQSARIKQRVASQPSQSTPEPLSRSKRTVTTPGSSSRLSQQSRSPQSTPRKPIRRVQVVSPPSPYTETSPPESTKPPNSHLQPFLSSTTTMINGIPTPVKTPKKKKVPNVSTAARALFQGPNGEAELVAPSPRKGRKTKRYNGFSLESFRAEEDSGAPVQIYTDNRDKVPEVDTSEENPFTESTATGRGSRAAGVAGGTKRRKVSGAQRVDPQVAEVIEKDEGMVYVFRGRKVYRRYGDTGEDEEEIDAGDLGLLGHVEGGPERAKTIKTLTRKSIKPTRLFQSEMLKRARARQQEEEALTDVEDHPIHDQTTQESAQSDVRSDRTQKASQLDEINKPKTGSPFDSWPRVKGSGRPGSTSKGQKRTASDALEDTTIGGAFTSTKVRKTRG